MSNDETDFTIGIVSQNLVESYELRRISRQLIFHAFRDRTGQSRGSMLHLTCGPLEAKCHPCGCMEVSGVYLGMGDTWLTKCHVSSTIRVD